MSKLVFKRCATSLVAAGALAGCGSPQQAAGDAPPPLGAATTLHHVSSSSYRVLYRFDKRPNGDEPWDSLVQAGGSFYGTASGGGGNCHGNGCGTVFTLKRSGAERLLFSFDQASGNVPLSGLIDVNGTLYGTTNYGGAGKYGTVYSLSTSGKESVLYSFMGGEAPHGAFPANDVVDVHGTLYGVTSRGGIGGLHGNGIVFSIDTVTNAMKVLYRFKGDTDGSDPDGSLIGVNGTLYGVTALGGAGPCHCGTVYSITSSGAEKVVYSFAGASDDGDNPRGRLLAVNGTLYGTTTGGGAYDHGTVFSITTSGKERVLYDFTGGSDGSSPASGLIDVKGTLYGTTTNGGNYNGCSCGTVYSVTTAGSERVLYSFMGATDGMAPEAALTYYKGMLYGTTRLGGGVRRKPESCCGTVFALTP